MIQELLLYWSIVSAGFQYEVKRYDTEIYPELLTAYEVYFPVPCLWKC